MNPDTTPHNQQDEEPTYTSFDPAEVRLATDPATDDFAESDALDVNAASDVDADSFEFGLSDDSEPEVDDEEGAGSSDDDSDEPADESPLQVVAPEFETLSGRLSFVASHIGNREDITLRALRRLQEADLVVCEEIKEGARLLREHNISKKLVAMNEHNEAETVEEIIDHLRNGKRVAVISDAGLPLLADPGALLARRMREMGVEPEIVPGVSSITTALLASGCKLETFTYVGFLSRKSSDRAAEAEALRDRHETLVVMETPYRLRSFLGTLAAAMPTRQAVLCMNLTMKTQAIMRGTLLQLRDRFQAQGFRGEFVLVIDAIDRELPARPQFEEEAHELEMTELQHEYSEEDFEEAMTAPTRRASRWNDRDDDDRQEERRGGWEENRSREGGDRPYRRSNHSESEPRFDRGGGGGFRREGGFNRDNRGGDGGSRREGGFNRDNRGGNPRFGNDRGGDRPQRGGWGNRDNRGGAGGGFNRDNRNEGPRREWQPRGEQAERGGWNRDGGGFNRGGNERGGWNRDRGSDTRGGWNRDDRGNREGRSREQERWNNDDNRGNREGANQGGFNRGGEGRGGSGGGNRGGGGGFSRGGQSRGGFGGGNRGGGGGFSRGGSGGGFNRGGSGGGNRGGGGFNRGGSGGRGGFNRGGSGGGFNRGGGRDR